jgi:phosphoribosylformylglycinamidine (FGAM) synthase PurS component
VATEAASRLLANPVIESYRIDVDAGSGAAGAGA